MNDTERLKFKEHISKNFGFLLLDNYDLLNPEYTSIILSSNAKESKLHKTWREYRKLLDQTGGYSEAFNKIGYSLDNQQLNKLLSLNPTHLPLPLYSGALLKYFKNTGTLFKNDTRYVNIAFIRAKLADSLFNDDMSLDNLQEQASCLIYQTKIKVSNPNLEAVLTRLQATGPINTLTPSQMCYVIINTYNTAKKDAIDSNSTENPVNATPDHYTKFIYDRMDHYLDQFNWWNKLRLTLELIGEPQKVLSNYKFINQLLTPVQDSNYELPELCP